jgi:hypothetical protein
MIAIRNKRPRSRAFERNKLQFSQSRETEILFKFLWLALSYKHTRHDARWWPELQGGPFVCRHRHRVFSGLFYFFLFLLVVLYILNMGWCLPSLVRTRHTASKQAPPLLPPPSSCCAIGWCTCRAGNHFAAAGA